MPIVNQNNRNLHAKNTRSVSIAQNMISRAAPIYQEQVNNALRVNGYDCILYNKLYSGRKCSCSIRAKESPTLLDENGNATQEQINSLLMGTNFGINNYNDKQSINPVGSSIDVVNAEDTILTESWNDIGGDGSSEEEVIIDETNIFNLETDLSSGSAGRCGVCYNNSFVGGFSVFNGTRIVLDTTVFNTPSQVYNANTTLSSDLYSVTIDRTQSPYRFTYSDEASYVCFTVVLPANALSLDSIRVMDNFNYLNSALLMIANVANPTFVPLTVNNLMSYANGLPCWIAVYNVEQFTHLEIQLNSSSLATYMDIPRLSKTGDLSVLEGIDPITLVVSPLVPLVQPWDVIVDNVYGKVWRVTSVQNFNDRNLNILGWDIQARLVQEYELYYNLVKRTSVKYNTTNFNRNGLGY